MTPIQNLHYAIGQLAYAVAFSDGSVQREEREKFQAIIAQALENKEYSFSLTDIIFQIMEKDKLDAATTYEWAMKEIRTNSHYLSPEMKGRFVQLLKKIAEAYPPISGEEKALIEKFEKEIAQIHGDPVFYKK